MQKEQEWKDKMDFVKYSRLNLPGQKCIDFTVKGHDGKEIRLSDLLAKNKLVLIDFWASWCGPCQMVSPVIEQIGEENDSIRVGKVNVDEQGELTMQFRVVSIPTLVVMKGGEEVNRIVGAASKSEILAML